MKIITLSKKTILYLNKSYIKTLKSYDQKALEQYLKILLKKLNDKYYLNFDGYYNIKIYIDANYGIVIEIINEEFEYFDYFTSQIEMNIEVIQDSFLYELFDYNEDILKKFDVYKISDKIYLKPTDKINDFQIGKLLEFTQIIYGNTAKNIVKKAKKM